MSAIRSRKLQEKTPPEKHRDKTTGGAKEKPKKKSKEKFDHYDRCLGEFGDYDFDYYKEGDTTALPHSNKSTDVVKYNEENTDGVLRRIKNYEQSYPTIMGVPAWYTEDQDIQV